MKTMNGPNQKGVSPSLPSRCLASCRRLLTEITAVKRSILWEFEEALSGNRSLLHAAVNEAEALAWQTQYPHLLFPTLAREKAVGVSRWAARQRAILDSEPVEAMAA